MHPSVLIRVSKMTLAWNFVTPTPLSSLKFMKSQGKSHVLAKCSSRSLASTRSITSAREHIFTPKLKDIPIPDHLSLAAYILEHADKFSNRPCIIDSESGREYTYGEVDGIVHKVAVNLSRRVGVRKNDVIMLLLPNCAEFIFVFLAAAKLGAVVTPANPKFLAQEIERQARSSNSKLVVTSASELRKLSSTIEKVVVVGDIPDVVETQDKSSIFPFSILLDDEQAEAESQEVHPKTDVMAICFSSGTTSLPKGVQLTHKNLVTVVSQLVDGDNPNFYLHSYDCMLCVLPMFHIFCINCVLLASLRVGASILLMGKCDISALPRLIHDYKVTAACLVPPIILAIVKNPIAERYDISSLRLVMSGAASLGRELEHAFRTKFPNAVVGQGYGMTEAGPLISMSLAFAKEPFSVKPGSCGTLVRNTEAKIIDTETGESLSCNMTGEICVRGPQLMKGYLNNVEATKATIDEDGWLHTGDIGYIDEDEELFLVDRMKELIKCKGFQVAPAEIEAILVTHPGISDAAVIGKETGTVAGEAVVAFVVKEKGANVSETELKTFVAQHVVSYKSVSSVVFVASIPRTESGKILRKNLKEQLNAMNSLRTYSC